MYTIMADYDATGTWEHLYWQGDPDYAAFDVKCSLTMGDSGSVEMSVPKSNPGYARVKTRKTLLDFKVDGRSLGIFEVRELSRDVNGTMEVYAVGEMAWLFDSVQPQREYHNQTARQFLASLVAVHNAQCPEHAFTIGIVDVTDSNDSLYRFTNREQTLDCVRDKLVKRLGGNLRVRRANGVRYLDYVSDQTYGTESEQTIRFGENILDYTDNFSVEDICTELVPLGARLENDKGDNSNIGNLERRLTVERVNGGRDYIANAKLVERFGHIRTTRTWDDVTVASNLLAKARTWLDAEQYERMHISVTAVDLSLSSAQFGQLRMGDRAYVICEPFGLKASYPIRKRTYNPDKPDSDEIELGDTVRVNSYVASQVSASSAASAQASEGEHIQAEWLKSSIENVTAMMTGARGGYKLTEYDDEGRWLADYIMDSMDRATAKVVRKVTVDGTAYSTNGVAGPYDTAIMANGTILGKYIQAHSIKAEQLSTEYTQSVEDAIDGVLTSTTQLISGPNGIEAKVSTLRGDVFGDAARGVSGLKADMEAAIKVNKDAIALTVRKDGIQSAINQSADRIIVNASKFGWTSNHSSLTEDGTLTTKNMVATNANVTGVLTTVNSNGSLKSQMEAGIIKLYANSTVAGNIQGYKSSDGKYETRVYGKNGVSISTGSGTITLDANKLVAGGYTGYTGWVNGVYYSCGLRTTRT